MKRRNLATLFLPAICVALAAIGFVGSAQQVEYPQTRKVDHVDTYHGVQIADPYRWLEDDRSDETAKWVEEQNKVAFAYLEKIPYRAKLKERLERLYNYPKYTSPSRKGELYFFSKNDGLQNQSVLYVQKGLNGAPEVLIDPNKLSEDGTSRLGAFALSKDGKYATYGVSKAGSDWQEYFVMEIATKQTLGDKLEWIKASGASWAGNGFFYSRYDAPEKGRELSSKNEYQKVFFHRVGTPQSQDELVYEDKANPQRFHSVRVSDDEKYAFLYVSERGKGKKGNAVFYRDLSKTEKTFLPIVAEITDDEFSVIDNIGDKFLIETNRNAPNGKVVLFDPKNPAEKNWKVVIAEKSEPLHNAGTAGGKLFTSYLKDVTTRVYIHSLDGKLENEVKLPGLGTAGGFGGEKDDKTVFYSFSSMNYPQTIFQYDIATKKSTVFRAPEIPDFKPADYETKQVFYNSKDGTRVPMFLTYKKGIKLDGTNPTLLYGYGGFNIPQTPGFSVGRVAWLEMGGVYAVACLRGGSEYGKDWWKGGSRLNKQNVFDDFAWAGKWLIDNKYTSTPKLAIQGGSNGGLLVGATLNQNPELFGAAIPQVGVMDMLRFDKFTIGWAWTSDYGYVKDEADFKAMYAYSPYHQAKPGTKYPPVLVTTADHDDRVFPAHSFKYTAAMQYAQAGDAPVLIRIQVRGGHGAGLPTALAIEQQADIYAFLVKSLGMN